MEKLDRESVIYAQLNSEQDALKYLANSIYGYLSFRKSRFHAQYLAAFIAEKGREILTDAQRFIETKPYEIIYGDTDSLMVKTDTLDYDRAIEIGTQLCNEINKKYKYVKMEIEGVFRYLLLLKKKRYVGVSVTRINNEMRYVEVYKGVDLVSRDCSKFTAEICKGVLRRLFTNLSSDELAKNIYNYLTHMGVNIRREKDVNQFVIEQQLSKDPAQYLNLDNHAHARVALRTKQTKGDIVPYVICTDGSNASPVMRAYHPNEFRKMPSLTIDYDYYIVSETYPAIVRLCESIWYLEAKKIAECLDVKPQKKVPQCVKTQTAVVNAHYNCEPFIYKCKSCNTENKLNKWSAKWFRQRCPNSNCPSIPENYMFDMQNQLNLVLRALIKKYFSLELVCDNKICRAVTWHVPVISALCDKCKYGHLECEFGLKQVHDQLLYFKDIFDGAGCLKLVEIVDKTIARYSDDVDLFDLFIKFTPEDPHVYETIGRLFS